MSVVETDWKSIYESLDSIRDDFEEEKSNYLLGKNKKIRESSERKMRMIILRAVHIIESKPEVHELFREDNGNIYAYEEFRSIKYFSGDLFSFLLKIKEKFVK